MRQNIIISSDREKKLIAELQAKSDIKSTRIKKLLDLPDLTKRENSPIKIMADTVLRLPSFAHFDVVDFPRVVTVEENFDILNSPKDHPSRRETDTYYLTETDILRTHTTTMWSFYLKDPKVLEQLKNEGSVAALSVGIVFRKDEIDRKHFPAFHQVDALYICRKDQKVITLKDLETVELEVAKSLFGENIEYRFETDTFPFTDPSIQIEVKFNNDWMELNGSGLVHPQVLKNLGLDPEVYNGWAFGFGIDRLAMVKMEIPDIRILWSEDSRITSQFKDINSKYKEVSKYPAIARDISFVILKSISLNNYYELVRDLGEDLIEEVKLIDEYENDEKFGADKKSYTFRIVYRSLEKTLTDAEVNKIHDKITEKTKSEFNALVR